jgi:hypothetical protein
VATDRALSTLTACSAPLGRLAAGGSEVRPDRGMTLAAWLAGRPDAITVRPEWAPRMWEDMPAAWRN